MTLAKSNRVTDTIELLATHPFICAFMACMLITPLCFGAGSNVPGPIVFAVAVVFAALSLVISYKLYKSKKFSKWRAKALAVSLIVFDILAVSQFGKSEYKSILIFFILMFLLVISKLYINKSVVDLNSISEKLNCFYIMSFGFLMKLSYILSTSVLSRQNDVHNFGGKNGHAAYIEYLLNNKHLPDFDVREVWQFYHPPLHHTICAGWIDFLENFCGVNHNLARESLQMLSLFYSTACLILVYKILRHFKLSGAALYVPLAIFAVHPSFLIFAGSINNDILSITFILAAILSTLKWYQNPSIKNILKIALAVGFGMMTKLSVGLIAPAIAFVFVVALIKNRDKLLKFIKQYIIFGIVCCPLGLWWGIRNYIKFRVPINFVQRMDNNVSQYVGNIPFFERLTDFSSKQFSSVFEQWSSRGTYNEYNPTIAMLKNSLFGESINENLFPDESIMYPKILFVLGTILAVLSFIIMIIYLFRKNQGIKWEIKGFFMIIYFVLLGNYYVFCNSFAFTCTQNFRYIAPNLMIGVLSLGLMIKDSQKNQNKMFLNIAAKTVTYLSVAFCILCFLTYSNVFFAEYANT